MNVFVILSLSMLMFVIGLFVVLIRRQLLFILMGIEVMLNGVALAAIGAGQYWHDPAGQIVVLFLMIAAGCELSVVLMLSMLAYRHLKTTRIEHLNLLGGSLIKRGEL